MVGIRSAGAASLAAAGCEASIGLDAIGCAASIRSTRGGGVMGGANEASKRASPPSLGAAASSCGRAGMIGSCCDGDAFDRPSLAQAAHAHSPSASQKRLAI
jgi:hypothetical protein